MAISPQAFSPKEFRVAIQPQTVLGTQKTDGMQELNVDSVTTGTIGGVNNYDLKSGGGRILQDEHYFHQNSDIVSEITISGIYTISASAIIENITGDTAEPFSVASNYEPTNNIYTGNSLTAASSELLTLAILPPIAGGATPSTTDSLYYKDCVVTAFSWSGDMGTDGGLVRYSATFKTSSPVVLEQNGSGYGITVYILTAAETLTMSDWQTTANRIICGTPNLMPTSFSLNLENDAVFLGRQAGGVCEVIGRAGEFSATADISMKFDDNSAALFDNFQNAASAASAGNTIMSNASTPATAASWGFQFLLSVFTNVSLSEGDIMGGDASVKMVGYGVGVTTDCLIMAD